MNLASALAHVTTLTEGRKVELLKKHENGSLTGEEKEELKRHLAVAVVAEKDKRIDGESIQAMFAT